MGGAVIDPVVNGWRSSQQDICGSGFLMKRAIRAVDVIDDGKRILHWLIRVSAKLSPIIYYYGTF